MTHSATTTLTFPLSSATTALILNGKRDSAIAEQIDDYQQFIITDGAWQDFQPLLAHHRHTLAPKVTVIGDGDSIDNAPADFIHAPNQDYTDFEKALRYAIKQGHKALDVYWASGGEMDHFLGNLAVANQYAEKIQLHFFSDRQIYRLLTQTQDAKTVLQNINGRTISLFPFPEARVSATDLKYPLHELILDQHQQQSLRNRAIADTVILSVVGRVWLFVSHE